MDPLAPDPEPRSVAWFFLVLRLVLAAFFLFVAARNVAGDAGIAADFRRFGFPDWFRVVTAGLQALGAALLLVRPFAAAGEGVLALVLVGATIAHARHDAPVALLSPLFFLALVGILFVRDVARC